MGKNTKKRSQKANSRSTAFQTLVNRGQNALQMPINAGQSSGDITIDVIGSAVGLTGLPTSQNADVVNDVSGSFNRASDIIIDVIGSDDRIRVKSDSGRTCNACEARDGSNLGSVAIGSPDPVKKHANLSWF